jgi:hypothetical protein
VIRTFVLVHEPEKDRDIGGDELWVFDLVGVVV